MRSVDFGLPAIARPTRVAMSLFLGIVRFMMEEVTEIVLAVLRIGAREQKMGVPELVGVLGGRMLRRRTCLAFREEAAVFVLGLRDALNIPIRMLAHYAIAYFVEIAVVRFSLYEPRMPCIHEVFPVNVVTKLIQH